MNVGRCSMFALSNDFDGMQTPVLVFVLCFRNVMKGRHVTSLSLRLLECQRLLEYQQQLLLVGGAFCLGCGSKLLVFVVLGLYNAEENDLMCFFIDVVVRMLL